MKKKLALLLACAMTLGLTACTGGNTDTTTAAPTEAETTVAAADDAAEPAEDAASGDLDALIEAVREIGGALTHAD